MSLGIPITAAVGFAGVILTLWVNACLARRQHTRQVEHETRVLQAALRGELEVIRETLRNWLTTFADRSSAGPGIFTPFEHTTALYEALIGRLGLLEPDTLRAVVHAYLPIRQLPVALKLLEHRLTQEERDRGSASIDDDYALALKRLHEKCLVEVNKAIAALGG